MAVEFTSSSFAEPDNSDGTLSQGVGKVWLAKVSDFAVDGIKTRYVTPTTAEEEVSIDGDHAFLTDKGFVDFYHDPQSTETDFMASMNGEGKGANVLKELKVFYPGKKFEVEAMLRNRPQLIGLVGDIDCSNDTTLQIGSRCLPAYISAWEWALRNVNGTDQKGYLITIKAFSGSILNYSGVITPAT